jgi:hypothetical protein
MPPVAAAVAPRLVDAHGWLLVAVDADEQGIAGAGDAMRTAVDAGLVLGDSVRALDLGAHKDLADAWAAGWRHTWSLAPSWRPGTGRRRRSPSRSKSDPNGT